MYGNSKVLNIPNNGICFVCIYSNFTFFSVDGAYCLTCGADRKIKLWNPYKKLLLKGYGGHGNEVLDACGSCDSRCDNGHTELVIKMCVPANLRFIHAKLLC